jgi:hypothetical protein
VTTHPYLAGCLCLVGLSACGGGDFETADDNDGTHAIVPDGGPCGDETLLYLDGDGDEHGSTTTARACEVQKPGKWVGTGGDCDDGNADVHPGQATYFEEPYTRTGTGIVSFDYDCSETEDESGESPKEGCIASGLSCVGGGYIEAQPSRNGAGENPYCGSTQQVNCVKSGLECKPGPAFEASAIACR